LILYRCVLYYYLFPCIVNNLIISVNRTVC
jgi:hypothetical protein